jgi:hypothetical protein
MLSSLFDVDYDKNPAVELLWDGVIIFIYGHREQRKYPIAISGHGILSKFRYCRQ